MGQGAGGRPPAASHAEEIWREAAYLAATGATRALTDAETALLAEFEGVLLIWTIETPADVPPKLRTLAARVQRGERLGEADMRALSQVAAWLGAVVADPQAGEAL